MPVEKDAHDLDPDDPRAGTKNTELCLGGHSTVIWQLRRIHLAQASYVKIGVREARRPFDSWWEAGSIWAVTDPADALEFTVFQIGVTVRQIGGLALLDKMTARFGVDAPDALPWLVEIWVALLPDWEAREAFTAKFGKAK